MSDVTRHEDVRARLIEVGGKTSQDLGMGRISGQILVYLYLSEEECSLDAICRDLGLSKAAVSVAARQLESLGFLRRVWRRGDRKSYYRTADNIAAALQQGLVGILQNRLSVVVQELEYAKSTLEGRTASARKDRDAVFLLRRVKRAMQLSSWGMRILKNRILQMFMKVS